MKNKDNRKLIDEGLKQFKYRVGYKINETARYHPLVSSNEGFDTMPSFTTEAGEQQDAQKPAGGAIPPAPTNDQPTGMDAPMPPAAPETGGENPELPSKISASGKVEPETGVDGEMPPAEMPLGDPMSMGQPNGGQEVDDIQNDIIKHNIAAMQSIHDKLEGLDATVRDLNMKFSSLNAEVEEVREPSNSEKLMSKTNVSYPYYFNLNDFWSGNWFSEKRKDEGEKGMRKLPDGTFIADFDDLPQQSKTDVQNSFNSF